MFLYSRCSLENGLSSGFQCEHEEETVKGPGLSHLSADKFCICLCICIFLNILEFLTKQTSIVHLFMHTLLCLLTSCVCMHVSMCVQTPQGPVQATVFGTER